MIGDDDDDDDVRCYCYKWTWQPKTSSTNATNVKHSFATNNNMNKNKKKMLSMKCNKRKKDIVLDLVLLGNVINEKNEKKTTEKAFTAKTKQFAGISIYDNTHLFSFISNAA